MDLMLKDVKLFTCLYMFISKLKMKIDLDNERKCELIPQNGA